MAAIAPHHTNWTKTFSTLAFSALILSIVLSMPPGQMALRGTAALLHTPDLSRLPLSFEPNAGQADPAAHYMVHASGGTLLFTSSGIVLSLPNGERGVENAVYRRGGDSNPQSLGAQRRRNPQSSSVVSMRFVDANPSPSIESSEKLPGKVNYLLGKDPTKWHTGLPTYEGVTYSGLYPGVTLGYSGTDGLLKGTYKVDAGADPSRIRWCYNGADNVSLDEQGNLQITVQNSKLKTQNSKLTEQAPVAWQEIDGKRVYVSAHYQVAEDGGVSFALGEYDRTKPLTIDPTLTYSTYLGGFYGEGAADIVLDTAGNIYVTGATTSSDFPLTNPYQPVYGGEHDAFVTKLSADGSTMIYSTFLGGSGEIDGGDFGQSIMVDAAGNATIGGSTDSTDFPTTPDAYQIIYGGSGDLFISRLNADGSDLIFSTYYGNDGVEEGSDFATDAAGNTFFIGAFEGASNSYALLGGLSADGSQLLFVRSLGGHIPGPGDKNANTRGRGVALDAAGNIYVTGDTRAADFPVTPGAYRTTIEAFEDGFVTKLTPSGQTLLYSTYIPGGVSEYPGAIALDDAGNAYITGWTDSGDFPTTPGAFEPTYGDQSDAFVTKLNPSGSALVYSTFLGGPAFDGGNDIGGDIKVDGAGSAYIVGYTTSTEFPTHNPIQANLNGPYDAFITKFNLTGTAVDYSTYLGGSRGETASGVALDDAGNAYVCGNTSSTNFPTVNPVQPTNHGESDAFIVKIFDPSGVITPTPTRTGTPPTSTPTATYTPCAPDANYSFRRYTGASLAPGTTDVGVHCDDCITTVALPFSIRFYGQSFSSANLSSNGNIQFVSNSSEPFDLDTCGVGYKSLNYAVMPYFSDFNTTDGGVFTSVSGSAPNRIFNIEWRGCVYDPINFECTDRVNFEARLYEGSPTEQIDFVYAQVDTYNGIPAVVAVQEGSGSHYRQFSCLQSELSQGLLITFFRNTCASPTATPTGTRLTATATRTRTPTPTPGNCQIPTSWRTEAPMSIVRAKSAAAVVNNQLYVIGGAGASPTPYPRTTERFDPSTNTWTSLAPIPGGMSYLQAAAIGNKIYVMGNDQSGTQSIMRIYDTATNAWSTGAAMPEPLAGGGLTAYNGKIYIFGGQHYPDFPSAHVYEYDPVADAYTARANMPSGQSEIGAAAVGNRIYVVGGYQYIHYAYDPATNTWTTIAAPPTPSFSVPGVFAFGGELWVEGGYDNPTRRPYPPSQQVQIYNPNTNSWHFGPAFINPRYYSTAAGAIGSRAYVVGGIDYLSDQYPYDYLNSMESIAYGPCGSVTPTPTPVCTRFIEDVAIESVAYNPLNVTISVGSSIRWTNYNVGIHTATSDTGNWDSGELAPYQTFRYTFTTPGVYHYHCNRYAVMHGTITVLACPTTPTPTSTFAVTRTPTSTFAVTRTPTATLAVTRTPTITSTPGSITRTLTPVLTNTPTRGVSLTPTSCPVTFTDVQPSDYFYNAVVYLYCAGVISGYSDGTFRPYNNTTRAQLSKIIVLARGWQVDCPSSGHFSDVPPSNPFYCFIETAYAHGIISGYSGGTFQPNNNVTRGQLSKIIVLAMGWTDPCPSTGHFSDVLVGSPFFCFVETAFSHAIITGYSDGAFRPDNSATRGQICVITYRAITQP